MSKIPRNLSYPEYLLSSDEESSYKINSSSSEEDLKCSKFSHPILVGKLDSHTHHTNSDVSLNSYKENLSQSEDSFQAQALGSPNLGENIIYYQPQNRKESDHASGNLMNKIKALDFIKSDANRTSAATSDLSARYRGPTSKRYIVFAFFSALLWSTSQVIRGI